MSHNWWQRWTRSACAIVGLGLIGMRAAASPAEPPSATMSRGATESDDRLMTGRDAHAAPYPVRLRITGFLARQHARNGDTTRALREFHSMLSVDDPAWPDNEEGDAMRIARDMEVARMMTESGFYDHSIRVLETTRVLAHTNDDLQANLVDRQIESTTELAQLKGRPLPPAGPMELHASARPLTPASNGIPDDEDDSISEPPAHPAPPALMPQASVAKSAERPRTPLPDLPPAGPKPVPRVVAAQQAPKSEEPSMLGRFIPSRWRDNEVARSTQVEQQTIEQQRPMISPNISPTYCPECATQGGSHARSHAGVPPYAMSVKPVIQHREPFIAAKPRPVVAEKPAVRVTSAEQSPSAIANYASSTADATEKPKRGVLNKLAARRGATNGPDAIGTFRGKQNPLTVPPVVSESDEPMSLPRVESKPREQARLSEPPRTRDWTRTLGESGSDLKLTQLESKRTTLLAAKSAALTSTNEAPATFDRTTHEERPAVHHDHSADGPAIDSDSKHERIEEEPSDDATPATIDAVVRTQVGIAGQVTNPGIFAVEGSSTTLAALLRRAGGESNATKTRVLRRVELGSSTNEFGSQKDFYLQRLEVSDADAKLLATPVYGQEIVIVDGDGLRPVYIAIMPHFILQLPIVPDRPTTAHQIVEQLRVYWPNIRTQEIGVLRYADWGRAAKVARVQDDTASIDLPLAGGDVLYVDGGGLDQEQVLSAAEAIARIVGAKIRQAK